MAGEDTDQEDKTEEPSERRLQKAIERGDVPKSIEVNTFFLLGGFALAVMILAGPSARDMALSLKPFLGNAHLVPDGSGGVRMMIERSMLALLVIVALPLLALMLFALAGAMIQHKPLWTFEPMTPKPSRLSPMAGFKRIFGKEALVQFVKGLLKIVVIGAAAFMVILAEKDRVESLVGMEPGSLLMATQSLVLKLLGTVLAIFAFIAAGDFLYQQFSWRQRQRMTKQEVKDEYKETEGNPEVKQKRKSRAQALSRRRMMQKVPEATVVIMNPTHYAVALEYKPGMPAPLCVAKGVDALALKIRSVAEENRVPVVENPPLARALHASVEIDEEIPVEHYKAVAEVIGTILRLRRRRA